MNNEENINDDLIDESLKSIFDNKEIDLDRFKSVVDKARANSVNNSKVERKRVFFNIDMKDLKKVIAGVVISAFVVVSGANYVVDKYNDNMVNVSSLIGATIYDDESVSILSHNTGRNGEVYYYNHDAIARDLLKLDSELFDYAFCSLCNDMGNSIDDRVGISGLSNVDSVIFYLRLYSKVDGIYPNEDISNRLRGINTLDEFLIRNNYVDNAMNPSFASFKNSCDDNVENIQSIIQNLLDQKGVSK